MKRLFFSLAAVIVLAGTAFAEDLNVRDILANVPALKQGVAYSLLDHKLNYLSTFEVAKWKGFALEAGYAGAAENTGNKLVAVASYRVTGLKDLGVEVPILDLVEFNIGAYAGFGRVDLDDGTGGGNNELDYGVSATLISLKF